MNKTKLVRLNRTEKHVLKGPNLKAAEKLLAYSAILYNAGCAVLLAEYNANCKLCKTDKDEWEKQRAARKSYFSMSTYTMRDSFKDMESYKYLGADRAHFVFAKLYAEWFNYFKAAAAYRKNKTNFKGKPKPPHGNKKRYHIIYGKPSIFKKDLRNGYVKLSRSRFAAANGEPYIKVPFGKPDHESISSAQLVSHRGTISLHILYTVDKDNNSLDPMQIRAFDPGQINVYASVGNKGLKPHLIRGGQLVNVNEYTINEIRKSNKRTAACDTKRARRRAAKRKVRAKRQAKRNIKRLQQIVNKGNNIKKHILHHISKKIVNDCVKEGTGTIVIGKNEGQKQNINMGRVNNRKFHYIPHDTLFQQIEYKSEKAGIIVKAQEESYTSKCSWPDDEAVCKHSVYKGQRIHTTKPQRQKAASYGANVHSNRLFKSANGSLYHSDLNGAANIPRKYDPLFRVTNEGIIPLLDPNILSSLNDLVVR